MINKSVFLFLCFFAVSCSSQKKTTATSTPVAAPAATTPAAIADGIPGKWKLARLEIVSLKDPAPADELKKFVATMLDVYTIEFFADNKYHSVSMHGSEDGQWSTDKQMKTIYQTTPTGKDTIHIIKQTADSLTVRINTNEGDIIEEELVRIKE
jgi:hypothetical protein